MKKFPKFQKTKGKPKGTRKKKPHRVRKKK